MKDNEISVLVDRLKNKQAKLEKVIETLLELENDGYFDRPEVEEKEEAPEAAPETPEENNHVIRRRRARKHYKKYYEHTCTLSICGSKFKSATPIAKFCSRRCHEINYRLNGKRGPIQQKHMEAAVKKYGSTLLKLDQQTRICEQCKKSYTPNRARQYFCSRHCWNVWSYENINKPAREEKRKLLDQKRESQVIVKGDPIRAAGH